VFFIGRRTSGSRGLVGTSWQPRNGAERGITAR
jgi:hypothetical protein